MKYCAVILVLLSVIGLCYSFSQPVVKNTRKEGCWEGQCGSHCDFQGTKLFPDDNKNDIGKCRMLRCASNFDLYITPCSFDMTGETEYVDQDDSKPFPECCGRVVPRKKH
ncbi:hypothetical protein PVAND_003144 [Polypedilum vanderplanki]|uniref:Single domain-containing protein n=1 Tax=Polypedilum vanderplanki TaxID=319348 RepID=A0A9J6BU27_POLVA|nr:hypothetical protein PVAND_003144 [Polypedilum vanderplanki]